MSTSTDSPSRRHSSGDYVPPTPAASTVSVGLDYVKTVAASILSPATAAIRYVRGTTPASAGTPRGRVASATLRRPDPEESFIVEPTTSTSKRAGGNLVAEISRDSVAPIVSPPPALRPVLPNGVFATNNVNLGVELGDVKTAVFAEGEKRENEGLKNVFAEGEKRENEGLKKHLFAKDQPDLSSRLEFASSPSTSTLGLDPCTRTVPWYHDSVPASLPSLVNSEEFEALERAKAASLREMQSPPATVGGPFSVQAVGRERERDTASLDLDEILATTATSVDSLASSGDSYVKSPAQLASDARKLARYEEMFGAIDSYCMETADSRSKLKSSPVGTYSVLEAGEVDASTKAASTSRTSSGWGFLSSDTVLEQSLSGELDVTVTFDDMDVILPQSERPKPTDYGFADMKEKLTAGMKSKIGAEKFAVTGSGDKGDLSDKTSFVDKLELNSEKVKTLHVDCKKYDFGRVFMVQLPREGINIKALTDADLYLMDPRNIFDFDQDGLNIFTEFHHISLEHITLWQRFLSCKNKFVTETETFNSNLYLHRYVENSLTRSMSDHVKKSFEKYFASPGEQGGASYLWIMLKVLFAGSKAQGDALLQEFEEFKNVGAGKTRGENWTRVNNRMKRIIPALRDLGRLDRTMVEDAFQGTQKSDCLEFRNLFTTEARDLLRKEMSATYDITIDPTKGLSQDEICDEILKIFQECENAYTLLNARGRWTGANGKEFTFKVGQSGRSDFEIECWNCGENHHCSICPHPKNPERIALKLKEYQEKKKAKAEAAKKKAGGEKAGGEVPTRDSSGNTNGGGTKPPASTDRIDRSTGKMQFPCYTCSTRNSRNRKGKGKGKKQDFKWTNHTTEFHDAWAKNKDGFCMSVAAPNHPTVLKQKDLDAVVAKASSGTTPSAPTGSHAKTAIATYSATCASLTDIITSRPGTYEASEARAELEKVHADFAKMDF